MQWQPNEEYTTVLEDQFSIHFANHYDKTGRIDNWQEWQRILAGFEKFLAINRKSWREEVRVENNLPEKPLELYGNLSWEDREEPNR